MLLAPDSSDSHPYLYARVIGVYHLYYLYVDGNPPYPAFRLDVLHVWWFSIDQSYAWGWKKKRLPRIRFCERDDPDAFGFVDPARVLRASYLEPAFNLGHTAEYLPPGSPARVYQSFDGKSFQVEEDDWKFYYVNMYV
jgi:hypothetical protein